MTRKLIECVPNFSEGKDRAVLDAITAAIAGVDGVLLLDVDPGEATNRTVVTFVGGPEAVEEAAFRGIAEAAVRIDMRRQHGEHPRMGATDVCPFIPISGVTMAECVEIARRVGERVGRDLKIPVYLYEKAATRPERRSLADIRVGEYEALPEKLKNVLWKPDFGPAEFNPKCGATVIGAREFLIAYNVNLNTTDKRLASQIAMAIREAGRAKKNPDGSRTQIPGLLSAVRAVGWFIEEYGCAQVSINLLDYHVTPPHVAFEACVEEARKLGLRVTGSEIVGLIPREALLMAGRFYLERQEKSAGLPEKDLIRMAIRSLGLSEFGVFDPRKKIIEYRMEEKKGSLMEKTMREFVDEVSRESPAPGGGSVAALCGALGGALAAMVANLTVGKKKYQSSWESMKKVAVEGQELKDWYLTAVDEDAAAFERVMEAFRLSQKTPEEISARDRAIESATKQAAEVPLAALERSSRAVDLAFEAARAGNPNSVSDAGVAALCARACAEGAYLNVVINLKSLKDEAWAKNARAKAQELRRKTIALADEVMAAVEAKL